MISTEKDRFLSGRFQQNNSVCCLESHFTSISGTCFFEANHHGRSAPQLHSCHSVPWSKGLANPPIKDISTGEQKVFTNKIRVLISRNLDKSHFLLLTLLSPDFSQTEAPVSANVPWAMLVILAMLAMLAWMALERTTTTGWSWSSWWSLG